MFFFHSIKLDELHHNLKDNKDQNVIRILIN